MTRTDKGKWYAVLEVMDMDTNAITFCILFVAWLIISGFTHDFSKAFVVLLVSIFVIEWFIGLALVAVVAWYTPWLLAGNVILIIVVLKIYHVF